MRRLGIVAGIIVLFAIVALVPVIIRHNRHVRMVEAIDRMQPDSIVEIKQLLSEGADITTHGYDNTVAMVAAFWNDTALLEQALAGGVEPNATDSFGNTALHFANFAPGVEPAKLLLEAGANVNVQSKRGETPLMGAVRNAQFELIKLLLQAGARVDLTNERGESALSIAQALVPGGPHPMRPDLTADDFVQLLNDASQVDK